MVCAVRVERSVNVVLSVLDEDECRVVRSRSVLEGDVKVT
jgi:hypothetical protein